MLETYLSHLLFETLQSDPHKADGTAAQVNNSFIKGNIGYICYCYKYVTSIKLR